MEGNAKNLFDGLSKRILATSCRTVWFSAVRAREKEREREGTRLLSEGKP